jgi:hypothetical protein
VAVVLKVGYWAGRTEQLRGWETRGGPELTEQRTTCCLDAVASPK